MAGAEGFEPSNTGSKVPRLTAWPRPTVTNPGAFQSWKYGPSGVAELPGANRECIRCAAITATFGRIYNRRLHGVHPRSYEGVCTSSTVLVHLVHLFSVAEKTTDIAVASAFP